MVFVTPCQFLYSNRPMCLHQPAMNLPLSALELFSTKTLGQSYTVSIAQNLPFKWKSWGSSYTASHAESSSRLQNMSGANFKIFVGVTSYVKVNHVTQIGKKGIKKIIYVKSNLRLSIYCISRTWCIPKSHLAPTQTMICLVMEWDS